MAERKPRDGRGASKSIRPSSESAERVSPHNLEAERAVLGAVLVEPTGFAAAAALVRADDFYRTAHAVTWQAMEQLAQQDVAIDLVTLAGALGESLEECGGRLYLAGLVDGVPRSTNIAHYAGMVRELAQRRAAIAIAGRTAEACYAGEDASTSIVERAINDLSAVVHVSGIGLVSLREAVDRYVDAVQRGVAGLAYQTGFLDLDAVINGLKPGDLVIVAARPSTGKSSFGLSVADHIAGTIGPVLYSTMEMSPESLAARRLSWKSRVSSLKIERQTATDTEYFEVGEAAREIDTPLWIEGMSQTLRDIAAWARLAKTRTGLVAIVVDYIQLLATDTTNTEGEMKAISAGLKRLAKQLDVVVIAISQLNRAVEGRKDKRPHVSDLRGSGALEQDCDLALLLFREEMYSPKPDNLGIAEVIIAKNRNGPTGMVRLAFTKELAMFTNLAREF